MEVDLAWPGLSVAEDDRLAIRCRNGERTAFDEIVSRYQLRLFRFALRLLHDRSEAEDAVQETFVRAYRALPAYRPDGYFSSWIYRILLNECRRRVRTHRPTLSLDLVMQTSDEPDPEASLLSEERSRQLREAVDTLPEHYRIVMMLFYFEEMSIAQISRALDITVSAVKVRLHRGRDRLATRLEYRL